MRSPGVYTEELLLASPRAARTGVPAFIGLAATGPVALAQSFLRWRTIRDLLLAPASSLGATETTALKDLRASAGLGDWPGAEEQIAAAGWTTYADVLRVESFAAFRARFGPAVTEGMLSEAVRAFFVNGGRRCYVLRLAPRSDGPGALRDALDALDEIEDADLVCVPDLVGLATGPAVLDLARQVVDRCERHGRRVALLDTVPGVDPVAQAAALRAVNAALYHPWVRPAAGPDGDRGFVPPCGHVAGVIARMDERIGVHKAPANEPLVGVLDVETAYDAAGQAPLNEAGVNLIRAFPGRGIRIWGARTLADDPAWTYLPVRRLFVTAARWMETAFDDVAFAPAGAELWARIELRLTEYFEALYRRGALRGTTREEAFFVRCDAETNPPSERDAGRVSATVGLAPAIPAEFVVVHITRDADGTAITGPTTG